MLCIVDIVMLWFCIFYIVLSDDNCIGIFCNSRIARCLFRSDVLCMGLIIFVLILKFVIVVRFEMLCFELLCLCFCLVICDFCCVCGIRTRFDIWVRDYETFCLVASIRGC